MTEAIARLVEVPRLDETDERHASEEAAIEKRISLNEHRLEAVMSVIRAEEAKKVIDLGCGEGRLLRALLEERSIRDIVGMDVSHRSLEIASARLRLDQLAPIQKERIKLIHGSLTYRDKRLEGFDAATVIEVIEHLDASRLASFERILFEFAKPKVMVITTPNAEYNVRFESLPAGRFRHEDHRFEWTRVQYRSWAQSVAARFGYAVEFKAVGPDDPVVGPPTQMGVFSRRPAS
jgi:3' terminal RNA ribose 2'-O-methyltransferase Hen1